MEMEFQAGGAARWKTDAAITFALKGEGPAGGALAEAAPWLSIAPGWRDFRGKEGELATLYGPPGMDVPRVLAVGMGEAESWNLKALRHGLGKAARLCREYGVESLGVDVAALDRLAAGVPSAPDGAQLAREAALSVLLALYRYDRWLTSREDREEDPLRLVFLLEGDSVPDALREAVLLGEAEARGVCLARDLANGPANAMTPSAMAKAALSLAERHSMRCRVLGPAEMEKEKMGALLAVARGAEQEPRLIVLEYAPEGAEGKDPVVLVGKGITFDSGGISLKPPAHMHEMKGDMSGAAAVLGVFEALGLLAGRRVPARPVIGLLPCTENMPDGDALHPGDIIVTKAGKTVEIISTDAEGRLILADALAYAQENWKPCLLVDIATLTGACVVALGKDAAGLFCDDSDLAASLARDGEKRGERFWRMPLWEDAGKEALKSAVADMANAGPREGGAIHAAVFLKQFVRKDVLWAHLDIAAADNTESPVNAKGASGFGVRTLLEALWRA